MNYKIRKKLIHFYTSGSIAEDFVASRRKKVSVLRKIIRACFYLHCAAALICIALSIAMGAGLGTIETAAFFLISAWAALFAVGEMKHVKAALFILDFVFAAVLFISGAAARNSAALFISGAVMTLLGIAAVTSYFAALCKDYLEEYSPRLIRREDYTLLPNFSDDIPDVPELSEDIPPLPPLTSEMRELSKQLKEILCAKRESPGEPEKIIKGAGKTDEDSAENQSSF